MSLHHEELRKNLNAAFSIWVAGLINIPNMRTQVQNLQEPHANTLFEINTLWAKSECPEGGRKLSLTLIEDKNKALITFLDAMTDELEQRKVTETSHNIEFVTLFEPIVTQMRNVLDGLSQPVINPILLGQNHDVPTPRKIPLFFRNSRHNDFMKNITKNLDGLHKWVRDFYCDQYLFPDSQKDEATRSKRLAIITHLKQHPPKEGQTIQQYMQLKSDTTNRSLAELIGQNRKSSSSKKQPWGLQKIIDTFKYDITSTDIKPKLKAARQRRYESL